MSQPSNSSPVLASIRPSAPPPATSEFMLRRVTCERGVCFVLMFSLKCGSRSNSRRRFKRRQVGVVLMFFRFGLDVELA